MGVPNVLYVQSPTDCLKVTVAAQNKYSATVDGHVAEAPGDAKRSAIMVTAGSTTTIV